MVFCIVMICLARVMTVAATALVAASKVALFSVALAIFAAQKSLANCQKIVYRWKGFSCFVRSFDASSVA